MERASHPVNHQKKPYAKPKLTLPQCTQNKVIEEPSVHDVLFGRGGRINQHEGNINFRRLIHQQQNAYNIKANSKEVKANISRNIVEQIKLGKGRFLERQNVSTTSKPQWSKWWVEVDDSRAMSKTSQALREGAPSLRAQQEASREQKRKVVRTDSAKSSKRAKKSRKVVNKDITESKVKTNTEDRNPAVEDSQNYSLLGTDSGTDLLSFLPSNHIFELPGVSYDEGEVSFSTQTLSNQTLDLDNETPCAVLDKTPTTPSLESEDPLLQRTFTNEEYHALDSFSLNDALNDAIENRDLPDKNDFAAFPVTKCEDLFSDKEYQETDILLLVDVLLMQAA